MPNRLKRDDLRFYKPQIHALDTNINDILNLIDDKIKNAYNRGNDSVIFQLSGTFDIPKMSPFDARNKIHAAIISDLTSEDRGFQVQYSKTKKGRYQLMIKWKSECGVDGKENDISLLRFYSMPIDEQLKYKS